MSSLFGDNLSFFLTLAFIPVALFFIKKWAAGGQCDKKYFANAKGKNVLITGGNEGLGKQSAIVLVANGANVIITARSVEKAEAAIKQIQEATNNSSTKGSISYVLLDLSDLNSVRKAVDELQKKGTKIDILQNNAGVMHCPWSTTKQGIEMHFGVNHLGHFLLTTELIQKNLLSKDCRVVNLSSLAHKQGTRKLPLDAQSWRSSRKDTNVFELYSQSKMANILFTNELNKRYRSKLGLKAYAVHPGVVSTNLINHYNSILQLLSRPFFYFFFKTVEDGAQTQLYCSLATNLDAGGQVEYYSDCHLNNVIAFCKDEKNAEKFWELSEELIKTS